jgi:hypothetical protein
MFGRLKRVALDEIWGGETTEFKVWLAENLDILNETVGLKLDPATDLSTPTPSTVIAHDEAGRVVIIESQFGESDNQALGGLLMTLATVQADAAIWIVGKPQPEHLRTVEWLNRSSHGDFFLLQLEAVQIDSSQIAPMFYILAGPGESAAPPPLLQDSAPPLEETAPAPAVPKGTRFCPPADLAGFWAGLTEKTHEKSDLLFRPLSDDFERLSAGSGRTGIHFQFVFGGNEADVRLHIANGSPALNHQIFRALSHQQEVIEEKFGAALEWNGDEEAETCWIRVPLAIGDLSDEAAWDARQEEMASAMERLEKALRTRVQGLEV